jgi:hypothetical protein
MKAAYCAWPPQLAADIEVAEQRDGRRQTFIVSPASAGRFILLGETECRVLRLLGEGRTPTAICAPVSSLLNLSTLTTFNAASAEACKIPFS